MENGVTRSRCRPHGTAWCNLNKVSRILVIDGNLTDSEDDYDTEDEVENEDWDVNQQNIEDTETILEKAFKKLKKEEKLKIEKALIALADKFTTCTLNPEMAARKIDELTPVSNRDRIVEQAMETQTHYHTKTCKKYGPEYRFGMPRYPMW